MRSFNLFLISLSKKTQEKVLRYAEIHLPDFDKSLVSGKFIPHRGSEYLLSKEQFDRLDGFVQGLLWRD